MMVLACEACRSLKVRCIRSDISDDSSNLEQPCDRCKRQDRTCVMPTPRPTGRKQGSRGRYRGVEKALHSIRTEMRKAGKSSSSISDSQLLQGLLNQPEGDDTVLDFVFSVPEVPVHPEAPDRSLEQTRPSSPTALRGSIGRHPSGINYPPILQSPGDERAIQKSPETVSNPLGLLADASGEAQALEQQSTVTTTAVPFNSHSATFRRDLTTENDIRGGARHLLRRPGYVSLGLKLDRTILEHGLDALFTKNDHVCRYPDYFKVGDTTRDRDTGPDLDPIDQGLVSMEEVNHLFPQFFARLHPYNGILDPKLHTPDFVRSRSALLFTWILAIAAQFDHSSGLIAKRLRIHGDRLSNHVHANGLRSLEIAQGYYISLLSPVPAKTLAEERSWLYTVYAFGVVAELSLDRSLRQTPSSNPAAESLTPARLPAANEVSATSGNDDPTQLHVIGNDQDKEPDHIERLNRNRERTWLRILLWERAYSAASGRVSAFPETELAINIETWYKHPLADPNDRYTCAFILLRRHLASLHKELKRQSGMPHTSTHWVHELLDGTLQPWCREWLNAPEVGFAVSSNPSDLFLRYVYMHGRLWTLSFALHGAPNEAWEGNAIKEDCFEAAVNCCEIAVHDLQVIGEPMYCMLAPTWAMIAYAAVLALRLFPLLYGEQKGNEVELLALLSQVALQLERAGTTPSHRFGIAALLGQHLLLILRTRAQALKRDTTNAQAVPNTAGSNDIGPAPESVNVSAEPESFDALLTSFDPFLTMPIFPGDETGFGDGFNDVVWDWFGQGFGGGN